MFNGVRLYRDGFGNIDYGTPGGGAVPPFVNVAGARNGVSLDPDSFVVLGNDLGDVTQPAKFTSNRRIDMKGFAMVFFRSTLQQIQIQENGIVVQLLAGDLLTLADLGVTVTTTPKPTSADSPGVQIFSGANSSSLKMELIPTGLGFDGMRIRGDTSIVRTSLFWYTNGGLGIGEDDFSSNGNVSGLSVDGQITGQKKVSIAPADVVLSSRFDSGKVITNTGSAGMPVYTLPRAQFVTKDNAFFDFYCDNTDGLQVLADPNDTIRVGPNLSALGGTATAPAVTGEGNALRLVCLNVGAGAGKWVALSVIGTWTVV